MKKNGNMKYVNLPIICKEKIYKSNEIEDKKNRTLTIILIIIIISILLFCGYSMGKTMEEIIIKSKAEIAEPILIVENNPSLEITEKNDTEIYTFKIKNYKENGQITQINLKYYIEILHNENNLVDIELYENENKINLNNNKTDYMEISKDKEEEREYKVKINYINNEENTINDIMEKIQILVHSEQSSF